MWLLSPVESIELLLQIVVDESGSASGLEDDAAAWVRHRNTRHYGKDTDTVELFLIFFQLEPYLQRAPGFSRLQGVWSR